MFPVYVHCGIVNSIKLEMNLEDIMLSEISQAQKENT